MTLEKSAPVIHTPARSAHARSATRRERTGFHIRFKINRLLVPASRKREANRPGVSATPDVNIGEPLFLRDASAGIGMSAFGAEPKIFCSSRALLVVTQLGPAATMRDPRAMNSSRRNLQRK